MVKIHSKQKTSPLLKPLLLMSVCLIVLVSVLKISGFEWADLAKASFYQNLANPNVKAIGIPEGLRKEQVADVVAQKLDWNEDEKQEFLNAHLAYSQTDTLEGRYFPKTYLIHKDSDPVVVSKTMTDTYRSKVNKIKKPKTASIINEETALIVASMIQRESGGKSDMRLISGIIWNRIFKGMNLEIDATLQYAKGDENTWWPKVKPEDKKIDSPYNTYKYDMPPSPIASPGIDALEAAYNPQKTSCLFYIHDKKRKIHCAKNYEDHKKNIETYL